MATCFLFTQGFDEEQCLSLRLDEFGQVDAPLALRPIQEVKALQLNARTIVVLPTESSSLHAVELPWLGERKARAAIPYALEEALAQQVSTLHFSFDRPHYQHHRYLVVATDRAYLVELIAKLDALHLNFDVLTLDWFALKENEVCATDAALLIRDKHFNGALSGDPAMLYFHQQEKNAPLLLFTDSLASFKNESGTLIDSVSSVWIAQRLLEITPMNLCQAELQHDTQQHSIRYWYRASAIVFGTLMLSLLLLNVFQLYFIKTKIADVDQKIAVSYHEFFPNSHGVISPKFRITQLLTSGFSNSDTAALWFLLDKLAHAFKDTPSTIDQLRFQHRSLSVTLVTKDFAALEAFQQALEKDKIKVIQSQAFSQKNEVRAILELSL